MVPSKKLVWITFIYWFLLLYIISALIWWFIALINQADAMTSLRISGLDANQSDYDFQLKEAKSFKSRKVAQYIGEGSIFLVLIIIGAVFVYRSVRRQLRLAKQEQNFLMAVTHELKTPIAATKLNLETLFKRKLDEGKQKMLLQSAIQETDRLNDLTNNILLASKMDGGIEEFASEQVELFSLFPEIERKMKNRYPTRSFKLDWKVSEKLSVKGDPLLLNILISNLLDNAFKYTRESDRVILSAEKDKAGFLVSVADTGKGIAVAERKMIFKKFYRSGSERNREAKGTGLGLYLCTKIVEGLQGQIWVEEHKPTGAIFRVHIPQKHILS